MKLSTIFFSALLILSDAQDAPLQQSSGRRGKDRDGGGRGGGGGGREGRGGEVRQEGRGKGDRGGRFRGRGKRLFATRKMKMKMKGICYWGENESQPLLDRIQEECDSNNPCDGVEPDQLDICTNPSWETMGDEDEELTFGECSGERLTDDQRAELKTKMQAKKEAWKSMTDAERLAFKEQKEAIKASNNVTVLLCGCCKGTDSIVTLVKDREFAVAKTLGFRRPKGDGVESMFGDSVGGRGGRGGRGRGKGKGKHLFSMMKMKMKGICYWGENESQPLLDRIQEECDSNNPCDGVEPDQLDICTNPSWETMGDEDEELTFSECSGERLTDDQRAELKTKMQAKKEAWKSMTDAERLAFKEQKEAIKASNNATVLLCGCCKGTDSIATLVKDREFAVAKTLGFRRPQGDGVDITLEEKCAAFIEEDGCAATEEKADGPIDCDWFDSANGERGFRLKKKLYCGCCRDPIDDLDPVDSGGD